MEWNGTDWKGEGIEKKRRDRRRNRVDTNGSETEKQRADGIRHERCFMVQYLKVGSKDIHEDGAITYNKDWYRQGFVYKDEEAFLFSEDDVCYIAEDDYPEEEKHYTRKDILRICDGDLYDAKIVFYLLDWQHPETVYDELYREDICESNY